MLLKEVHKSNEIARAQKARDHVSFPKLDRSRYAVSVDFYFHLAPIKDESEQSLLQPYFRIRSNGSDRWFKIIDPPNRRDSMQSVLTVAQASRVRPTQVSVRPATGDPAIPLFDLQWSSFERGQWSVNREIHMMLDLRRQPRITADLSCNAVTAFGACGVYAAQHQTRNTYDCEWSKRLSDFMCRSREWNDDGEKLSQFALLSGTPISYKPPPGGPPTLADFAERAEHDRRLNGYETDIPGLGKTIHLLRVELPDRNIVHMFATYGQGHAFKPRFVYAILRAGEPPEIGFEVANEPFGSEEVPPADQAVQEGGFVPTILPSEIRRGPGMKFRVKPLFESPRTHIYQIAARIGDEHSLFWLAVDEPKSNEIFVESALMGSEGFAYAGCAEFRSVASAASITLLPGPAFRATIEVEPSHITSEFYDGFAEPPADGSDEECPYSTEMEWKSGDGWHYSEPQTSCSKDFAPREIIISDDGAISTKLGTVHKGGE